MNQDFNNEVISVDNAAGGLSQFLFDKEMDKVIENIYDETTDERKARKITLEFEITPEIDGTLTNRDDRICNLKIAVKSKSSLCGTETKAYPAYISRDGKGNLVPVKFDPSQIDAFTEMSKLNPNKVSGGE